MTARTHEAIRVGLRRIIRDDNVSPKVRMDAIELLIKVEGLLDLSPRSAWPKNKPAIQPKIDANDKELMELLELAQEQKLG